MDVTQLAGRCPRCGNRLLPDAPDGLCAACLFTAGAETLTHDTSSETPTVLSPLSSSAAGSDEPRLETGQRFGPYRIGRLLGRGGMGEVYEAEHADTGRQIALKVLRSRLNDAEDRARFLHEGQLAASVSHPHTVYIFGSEEIAGMPVISMELLPGGTLKDRVAARGPLAPDEAVGAVLDIIGGLDAARASGILHRDIKPSNCFVDADGAVKVGDFGLSISTLARDVHAAVRAHEGFQGTPQFAAPEQLLGRALDVRADIYAVGATLYYLLTGRPPFVTQDLGELVSRVTTSMPDSPRTHNPRVPPALSQVVLRCLATDPADRPSTYAALADQLRPFAPGATAPANVGARAIAGAIDALLIGLPFSLSQASIVRPESTSGFQTNVTSTFGTVALGLAYFIVLEGIWGASIGKRLLGLRVVAASGTLSWSQVLARTATYYTPTLPLMLLIAIVGRDALVQFMNARPVFGTLLALSALTLSALLYVTMRRSNGFAAVHDLVSRTRVVARTDARGSRFSPGESGLQVIDPTTAMARCGPFNVTRDLGEGAGARLLEGFDPVLRRRVWIRAVPSGTPAIDDARRDAGRSGRLHWLAGRRSSAENWDAYELPDGAALLDDRHAAPSWTVMRGWLRDLSAELAASETDGSLPRLALDRLWVRRDGRVVLLDFPPPAGAVTAARRAQSHAHAHDALSPTALLGAVAGLALPAAGAADAPPSMPLGAIALVQRWSRGDITSIAEAHRDLAAVSATADGIQPLRRAIPVALPAVPIVLVLAGGLAMMPALRSITTPARFEIYTLLERLQADDGKTGAIRDAAHRDAIETYLAGRHRAEMLDAETWRLTTGRVGSLRETARAVANRHPDVTPAALADAERAIAPDLASIAASLAQTASRAGAGEVMIAALLLIAGLFVVAVSAVSTLIHPGGLVVRAVGLAVVDRDGREIGRGRALLRLIVIWSPLVAWLLWLLPDPLNALSVSSPVVASVVILTLLASGATWTLLRRSRGPHDWIAGTWMVPR